MGTRIIAVRVAEPGTHEQHITDFKTNSGNVMPKISMIGFINYWGNVYYTLEDGKRAELVIAYDSNGMPYVKTKADNTTKNNLLSLPRF